LQDIAKDLGIDGIDSLITDPKKEEEQKKKEDKK
jgi:hypothetical protein